MNSDDLDAALARLTLYDEDSGRAERTRRACHASLARRRAAPSSSWDWLEPAAALALSGLYLSSAVGLSVAFLRAFR